MEKNGKEHETKNHHSNFDMKVLLLVLCVIVVVQLALFAKCFASLKDLNNKFNVLKEEKTLALKPSRSETHEPDATRSKRSIEKTEFKMAMVKLEKLEGRLNQSYQYAGRQFAFLLRGPPGKPGRDGTSGCPGTAGSPGTPGNPGTPGSPGTKGSPGRNGRDGRDGVQGVRGEPGVPGKIGPAGPKGSKGIQGDSAKVGVTYIRWGKKTCPNTGTTLVYEGYVGGSHYKQRGGGSNYVCLTRDPIYERFQSGSQTGIRAKIYGAQYDTRSNGIIYPSSIQDHEVPCAVCHVTKRASQMMIPGRNVCPAGWTREYKGYLMTEYQNHHRTMYSCVDEKPDYTRATDTSLSGAYFYFVEGVCGLLHCKPYIAGRELTCVVCTR